MCYPIYSGQHIKRKEADIMMLIPRRNDFDLLGDLFDDTFFNKSESKLMRTDIKERENDYVIDIDLPGYDKENIKVKVNDGYLTIEAKTKGSDYEKDGKYVRKERYFGECSRSFYIGENIKTEDVKAKFTNVILSLQVPKKEEQKEIEEDTFVNIEEQP